MELEETDEGDKGEEIDACRARVGVEDTGDAAGEEEALRREKPKRDRTEEGTGSGARSLQPSVAITPLLPLSASTDACLLAFFTKMKSASFRTDAPQNID